MEEVPAIQPEIIRRIEAFVKGKGLQNLTVEIKQGSAKGDNYIGVISKVTVQGTNSENQNVILNWILKTAPQNETMRLQSHVEETFTREVFMYENLFPCFKQFQEEKSPSHPFVSTPPVHMSCLVPYQECVLMEDMKALGYVMKNRKEPLDFSHVCLVMKAYGKFHALSYALKDQRPEQFKKIAEETEEKFLKSTNKDFMRKYTEMYSQKVLNAVGAAKDPEAVELYKKFHRDPFGLVLEAFDAAQTSQYAVVGHGDSWINNMLFRYNNESSSHIPTDVCLLDFQLSRYGSPAFDLSYFIFTCTDKELRDKHYDQMIKIYYYSLCAHLVDLGSDPEKLLPFSALQGELKRYSIVGFYHTMLVLYLMIIEIEEVPDMSTDMLKEDFLENYVAESKNESFYTNRMRGVVIDFCRKGYFDFLN